MVARDLQRILYRLHDQREKLAPSLALRRAHLTAAFHGQIRAEKHSIEGRIGRLQPGVRRSTFRTGYGYSTPEPA